MDQNEHLSLTERGRCAFEQAEEEKFTNPTAAAAYYIIASKCYLAAAESVDQLDAKHSLAYLGKTMITNAAFCSSLQGAHGIHPAFNHTSAARFQVGGRKEKEGLNRPISSPSSSHRRIDIVDRGRISGTQQIPKTLSGAHLDHKSRIECLEELEKELMFIGVLQSSLKGRGNKEPKRQYSEYSPVSEGSAGGTIFSSPARKTTRNNDKLQRAMNTSDRNRPISAESMATGPAGVLGGAAQHVLGTVNKLLQWNSGSSGYSWDPRKGLSSYYNAGKDSSESDPTQSMSQPWDLLDGTDSAGVGLGGNSDAPFDPYQSLNLHYSLSADSEGKKIGGTEDGDSAGNEDSFKRLLESMSRLSHENMDLQRRLHELSDLDLKCSEINLTIRQFHEKFNKFASNLPLYKEEDDISYLQNKVKDLVSKNEKLENEMSVLREKNQELQEQNCKLTKKATTYKSDIRRIAHILTQQEEIIKKYEAASLAKEITLMKNDTAAEKEKSRPQAAKLVTHSITGGGGVPLQAPSSHPSRIAHAAPSTTVSGIYTTGPNNNTVVTGGSKRPAPLISASTAGGMSTVRSVAPPLSPAASTFANMRKSNHGNR